MYVGCDPDTHTTAIAVIGDNANGDPYLAGGWVCQTSKGKKEKIALLDQCRQIVNLFGDGKFPIEWHPLIRASMVEYPEISYTAMQRGNPRDVMKLCWPASAYMSMALGMFIGGTIPCMHGMPTANEWKGNKPKNVDHARTYNALKLESSAVGGGDSAYRYPVRPPVFVGNESVQVRSNWKHLSDAIGIALKARTQYAFARRTGELELRREGLPMSTKTSGGGRGRRTRLKPEQIDDERLASSRYNSDRA